MARTKQTARKKSPDGNEGSGTESSNEAEVEYSFELCQEQIEQALAAKTAEERKQQFDAIRSKIADESGKLGGNENMQALTRQCLKAANVADAIKCAESLVDELTESENKDFMKELFIQVGCADTPDSKNLSKEEIESLYEAYVDLLRTIQWKVDNAAKSLWPFWEKLFQNTDLFHVSLLSTLNQYRFAGTLSDDEKAKLLRKMLEILRIDVMSDKAMKKKLSQLLNKTISAILNHAQNDNAELSEACRSIIGACKGKERAGWCKLAKVGSDDEDSDNDSDDDDTDGADEESKPLRHCNKNPYETCLHTIFQSIAYGNSNFDDMISSITESNADYLLDRIEDASMAVSCGGASVTPKECNCNYDPITSSAIALILGYAAREHPRAMSKHLARIVAHVSRHPSENGLHALNKLYPYNSELIVEHLDFLVTFGMQNCRDELYSFLMTVARYDGDVIKKKYVDEIESLLLEEKAPNSETGLIIQVLDSISENSTNTMKGRGDGYYDAIMRNTEDQEAVWMITDNIMKCIGLIDAGEAERIMKILINSCTTIPAKSHVSSVLESMQSIGLVYRSQVKKHQGWIDQQLKDPYLKKNAVKLMIILKGDPVGGANSSSSCSIS